MNKAASDRGSFYYEDEYCVDEGGDVVVVRFLFKGDIVTIIACCLPAGRQVSLTASFGTTIIKVAGNLLGFNYSSQHNAQMVAQPVLR